MTPQEKYDIITSDLLERDGQYVAIRTEGRLGWEDTLPQDSAYSSVLLHPKSADELTKNAVTLARQMLAAMATSRRLRVYISPDTACTDGNAVFVATKVLDDDALPLGKRLDTFLGLAVHEGCHILYTDFEEGKDITNEIIHDIHNVLEDERIEHVLGQDLPGMANYLKAVKYYYFNLYASKIQNLELPASARLFNTFLTLVRYPASMIKEDVQEFADDLLEIRQVLTPFPETTADTYVKAEAIYDIIRRYITKDQQQQQQQQKGDGQGTPDPDDDDTSSGDSPENQDTDTHQDPSSGSSSDSNGDDTDKENGSSTGDSPQEQGDDPAQGDDQQQGTEGTDTEKPEPASDEETRRQLEGILQAMRGTLSQDTPKPGENTLTQDDLCKAAKQNDCILASECDGHLERGKLESTLIIKPEANRSRFNESLERVRRHIPAIKKALTDNSFNEKTTILGCRNGRLDTNKIVEASMGIPTVYSKTMDTPSKRINIALVIDESGSMRGHREQLCRDAAVLISEAVKSVPDTRLFIYGYNSHLKAEYIYPYMEKGQKDERYTLGSIGANGCTPTAEAIIETTNRIRTFSSEKTLMFVLSDGQPDSSYQTVREAVNQAQKQNVRIIGISIASELNESALRCMYDSYIVMDNVQDLASELGKTVKKTVISNTRSK